MAPTARLPPKKDVALALLEQASMYIHLDPRADTVKVPAWFKKQPQLVLQVGLNMAVPIPDLHVDEQGLSCTLSFNRSPFYCMIPWPAVFALVGENGQAMVWAEDVPAEVAAQAQAQKAPEKPRAHLRSVGEGESAPAPVEQASAPEKKSAAKASKATGKPSAAPVGGIKRAAKAAPRKREASQGAKSKPEPKSAAAKPASLRAAPQKATKPAQPAVAAKKPAAAPEPAAKAEPATARPALSAKKPPQPKPEAARAATDISKPKRELPPYLRVVK